MTKKKNTKKSNTKDTEIMTGLILHEEKPLSLWRIIKEIWWRMIATFIANGLAVVGAGSIIGIDIVDAVILAGSLGVIKVSEQLARNYLDDGKLTLLEINDSFSVLNKGAKN